MEATAKGRDLAILLPDESNWNWLAWELAAKQQATGVPT